MLFRSAKTNDAAIKPCTKVVLELPPNFFCNQAPEFSNRFSICAVFPINAPIRSEKSTIKNGHPRGKASVTSLDQSETIDDAPDTKVIRPNTSVINDLRSSEKRFPSNTPNALPTSIAPILITVPIPINIRRISPPRSARQRDNKSQRDREFYS